MGRKTTTAKIEQLQSIIDNLNNEVNDLKILVNSRQVKPKEKDKLNDVIEDKQDMVEGIIERIKKLEEKSNKEDKNEKPEIPKPVPDKKKIEKEENKKESGWDTII